MPGTAVAVSVDSFRPKSKHHKSKSRKTKKSDDYIPLDPPKKKKTKKSSNSKDKSFSKSSSTHSERKGSTTGLGEGDLAAHLTVRQMRRLKKKEKRLANKEFKKHSRGAVSNAESTIDNDPIPERMCAYDDDNRDLVLVSDSDDKSDSEKATEKAGSEDDSEDKDGSENKKSTNSLVNNDDFIEFDFSEDENDEDDSDEADDQGEDGEDASYIPSIRSREESDDDDNDYAEPNTNGKRKAMDSMGPPKKKHAYSYEYPWMNNGHDYSSFKEIGDWLTKEIKDFVSYLSPSEAEIRARNNVIQRMQTLVQSMWADATVNVFGSYATDMYLPGSDIDMVITSPSGRLVSKTFLYQLSSKLKNTPGFAEKVTTIGKARVPIIKFVDRKSKIHIDISFERRNGLTAVEHIRKWAEKFSCLRHLVMPIKQFLAFRKLNDVSVGGIGGYSIICTVVSFLSLHPRIASGMIDPMKNLGPLLIEYFELYGKKFNFDRVALRMDPSRVCYVSKSQIPELCNSGPRPVPHALVIEDPDDPSNNLGRSTYNILKIRSAFAGAYEFITAKCYELHKASKPKRRNQSIIGSILKIRGPERDFLDHRDTVENIAWSNPVDDEESDDSDASDNNYNTNRSNTFGSNNYAQNRKIVFESDDSDDDSDYDPETFSVSKPLQPRPNLVQSSQNASSNPKVNSFIPKGPKPTGPASSTVKPSSSAEEVRKNKLRKYFQTAEESDDDEITEIAVQKGGNDFVVIDSDDDEEEDYEPSLNVKSVRETKSDKENEGSKADKVLKQKSRKRKMDYWSQKNQPDDDNL